MARLRSRIEIVLSPAEGVELEHQLRCPTTPNGLAQRIRAVFRFAEGQPLRQVSREAGMARQHVRKWLERFQKRRLQGLFDLPRPGRGSGRWR